MTLTTLSADLITLLLLDYVTATAATDAISTIPVERKNCEGGSTANAEYTKLALQPQLFPSLVPNSAAAFELVSTRGNGADTFSDPPSAALATELFGSRKSTRSHVRVKRLNMLPKKSAITVPVQHVAGQPKEMWRGRPVRTS